jgi:Transposase IS200 like
VEIRTGRHVVYLLHARLVFVTKWRGKVFGVAHLKRLEEIFRSACTDFEVVLKEFNSGSDHVHLLVISPEGPTVGTGQFPQGRLVPAYEAGIPSRSDVLERPKEQGAPVVTALFRGVRGRSANHGSPSLECFKNNLPTTFHFHLQNRKLSIYYIINICAF